MDKEECEAKLNLLGVNNINGSSTLGIYVSTDTFVFYRPFSPQGDNREVIGYVVHATAARKSTIAFDTYEEMLNAAIKLNKKKKQNG